MLNRDTYLHQMGIDIWVPRAKMAPRQPMRPPAREAEWRDLERQVSVCVKCELHHTRIKPVFGGGNSAAQWMLVGEAPGAEEDRQGLPFVGRAGQLLTAMLAALDIEREQVYITNVLKCRPPNNRDPMGEEVRECEGYLYKQVQHIQPKIILALGRFAAQSLLKSTRAISKLRGEVHRYGDAEIPLVVSYHPAYLLRNPIDKRKAWEDLCFARGIVKSR